MLYLFLQQHVASIFGYLLTNENHLRGRVHIKKQQQSSFSFSDFSHECHFYFYWVVMVTIVHTASKNRTHTIFLKTDSNYCTISGRDTLYTNQIYKVVFCFPCPKNGLVLLTGFILDQTCLSSFLTLFLIFRPVQG